MEEETQHLQWTQYSADLKELVSYLYKSSDYTDVTLVCDDNKIIKAHKFILGATSPVLKEILDMHGNSPWIYMRKTKYSSLQKIMEFVYLGEAVIDKDNAEEVFNLSMDLQIKEVINGFRSVINSDKKEDIGELKFEVETEAEENQNHTVTNGNFADDEDSNAEKNTEVEPTSPMLQTDKERQSSDEVETKMRIKRRGPKPY